MAKRRVKFRVAGTFDIGGGWQVATVVIDREHGLFSVRPLRRRREYTLPLAIVAAMVCDRIIKQEVAAKKAAKKAKRKK